MKLVSASILSADLLDIRSEMRRMEEAGVDMLHYDVMDGVFVNNISYGIPILRQIKKEKKDNIILDVHLMITDPLKYVRSFYEAGADIITFHVESESDTMKTIQTISECGARPAVAVKPDTPASAVLPYIPYIDMILVMTVEPGFGGQSFIDMSEKIRTIRRYADENRYDLLIEVDGGIDSETATVVKSAGADWLVSGSYLFQAENMKKATEILKKEI